jgi:hypothetical protein
MPIAPISGYPIVGCVSLRSSRYMNPRVDIIMPKVVSVFISCPLVQQLVAVFRVYNYIAR